MELALLTRMANGLAAPIVQEQENLMCEHSKRIFECGGVEMCALCAAYAAAEGKTISVKNVSLKLAVNKGIDWLNANVPFWRERIDWYKLDMSRRTCCILGQLFGNERSIWLEIVKWAGINNKAVEYGFTNDDYTSYNFEQLTNEWKRQTDNI